MTRFTRIRCVAGIAFLILPFWSAHAATSETTPEVYRHIEDRVVQVRTVEKVSGSKHGIGSGFFVSDQGHIITNYHVIAELVTSPERYRAEVVRYDNSVVPLKLLNIDVIHDVALVKVELSQPNFFSVEPANLQRGERIFSIGNPFDLGSTIVEGTYNGLIEESLYEKIHFSGSINPGMSGGPATTVDGRLVGVNVATAGNGIGFLVPAKFVKTLFEKTIDAAREPPNFADTVAHQILANQERYYSDLMSKPFESVEMDAFHAPGKLSSAFRCWANVSEKKDLPYVAVSHGCSTQDNIFLSSAQSSGAISFNHVLLRSTSLNRFQFASLYNDYFNSNFEAPKAAEDDVTNFRCTKDFVKSTDLPLRGTFCVRAYKRFTGVYDAVLRVATMNDNLSGLQSTLIMSGVSFENAEQFAQRYLQVLTWKKE